MSDPVNTEAPAPATPPFPRGQVLIDLVQRGDSFGVEVSVSGTLNTLESVGLLYMALKQHIEAKHTTEAVIYQTPTGE
jgi:hypothetical protein